MTIEPEKIAIPKYKLEEWRDILKDAFNPKVPYSDDLNSMQQSAYKERGAAMSKVLQGIYIYL